MIRQRLFIKTSPTYFINSYFFFISKITRFLFFYPRSIFYRKYFWFKRTLLQFRDLVFIKSTQVALFKSTKGLYTIIFFATLPNPLFIPLLYYKTNNLFFKYLPSLFTLNSSIIKSYYFIKRLGILFLKSSKEIIWNGRIFFFPSIVLIERLANSSFWTNQFLAIRQNTNVESLRVMQDDLFFSYFFLLLIELYRFPILLTINSLN